MIHCKYPGGFSFTLKRIFSPILKGTLFAILVGLLFYSGELTQILSKRSDFLGKTIKEVKFKGNKNTPDADLESMIEIKVGKILTKRILDRDLKNLFNSGFFICRYSSGRFSGRCSDHI